MEQNDDALTITTSVPAATSASISTISTIGPRFEEERASNGRQPTNPVSTTDDFKA